MEKFSKSDIKLFDSISKRLNKTLIVFDLETSSLDQSNAEILSICAIKITATGESFVLQYLVKPQKEVDPKSLEINGLTLEQLKDSPTIDKIIDDIVIFFDEDCIIAGYNQIGYDNNILIRIVKELGKKDVLSGKFNFDSLLFYRKDNPATLGNCYKHYIGKEPKLLHDSTGDCLTTIAVLNAQLSKYEGTPEEIWTKLNPTKERQEQVYKNEKGELVLGFTKSKGVLVKDMDQGLTNWIMKQSFVQKSVKDQINAERSKQSTT